MNQISSVTLFKVAPAKNMHRQYTVSVGYDLSKTPLVTCQWGRIGKHGQVQAHVCQTLQHAESLAQELIGKRQRRGYSPTRPTASASYASQPARKRHASPPSAQARRAVTALNQLPLFDPVTLQATWQGKQRPPTTSFKRESLIEALLTPSVMQRLGKPATSTERERERERAMAKLTWEASLRGLPLSRGAAARAYVR